MQLHLISGFLGSGKTTAIQTACKILLDKNVSIGVITNDQGMRLVDGGYFANLSIPNRQVMNGCFCCNFNVLDENIQSLIEANHPHVIFAESVGSCTDIVATVMKPLQQYRNSVEVTVSTFADALLLKMLYVDGKLLFKDEVKYIYQKQMEEGGIIVVTKIDLITADELIKVQAFLEKEYSQKTIVYVNATNVDSVSNWLTILEKQSEQTSTLPSLQLDYDTYGAGEAAMAWLDEELELYSNKGEATNDVLILINKIYQQIQFNQLVIGHLKFLVDGVYKISYTSTSNQQPYIELNESSVSKLLINARVQTTPQFLEELIAMAIAKTKEERKYEVEVKNIAAFQPGYPKPTHRISD